MSKISGIGDDAKVLFDYEAKKDDELTLKEGDVIKDIDKKYDGWWEGELYGERGMFPENFVEEIEKQPLLEDINIDTDDLTMDPVSWWNETSQRKRTKVEYNLLGRTGADHCPKYQYEIDIGGTKYMGAYGRTKKDAKKAAAYNARKVWTGKTDEEMPGLHSNECVTTTGKSDISLLYEYCKINGLPDPEPNDLGLSYEELLPKFRFAFRIGDVLSRAATAFKKSIAKEEAAKLALEQIKNQRVSKLAVARSESKYDKFAELSWNCFYRLVGDLMESEMFTILATIIVTEPDLEEQGKVVSLGTGNRCITGDRLIMDGTRVNDSHAEVIARRGFLRYLYHQLRIFYKDNHEHCIFEQVSESSKLCVKPGVEFHLYISKTPCGDAAVFVNDQMKHEESPELDSDSDSDGSHQPLFNSKSGYGSLRAKIENGEGTIPIVKDESQQTIDGIYLGQRLRTASCSDKILRWNVLGLQGALLSKFIRPVYLKSVTIGSLYNQEHLCRAMCCRASSQSDSDLPHGYRVHHPVVHQGLLKSHTSTREIETKKRTACFSLNWSAVDKDNVERTEGRTGVVSEGSTTSRISKIHLFAKFKLMSDIASSRTRYDYHDKSYNDCKRSAIYYQRAKKSFFECLQSSQYGSWKLMKKPEELQSFKKD